LFYLSWFISILFINIYGTINIQKLALHLNGVTWGNEEDNKRAKSIIDGAMRMSTKALRHRVLSVELSTELHNRQSNLEIHQTDAFHVFLLSILKFGTLFPLTMVDSLEEDPASKDDIDLS
jgi:hypothetical protein